MTQRVAPCAPLTHDRADPAGSTPPLTAGRLAELSVVLEPRGLRVGVPDGPDWADCGFLTSRRGVQDALERVRGAHRASAEVAASYLANWYSAGVVGPAIACFVLLRRVPELTPTEMSLRTLDSGWFDQTAFHRPRFAALPDDPDVGGAVDLMAEHRSTRGRSEGDTEAATGAAAEADPEPAPRVRIVADTDALRAVLVEGVLAHLEPFVRELRARVRLGYPALWGAVAAQCARAFLLTERATGDPHRGRTEADAFLALAAPTMRAQPRWQQFVHRGRPYTGMRRGSCCLAHRLGDEFCTSCPFTGDGDREKRLRAWIDTQGHGGLAV